MPQDLDAIMESRPDSNPEQGEQQQRNDGRDERGRFASQAREQAEQDAAHQSQSQPNQPAPQEGQQQEPDKPPPGFIPQQAFDARLAKAEEKFNERYSALEGQYQQLMRQMQQFQPRQAEAPKPPPDFFENPDAAFQARLQEAISPIAQTQSQIVEKFSRALAIKDYGQETVDAALAELTNRVNRDPNGTRFDYQRIMSSDLPYDALVRWHKAQSALKTYGDDPEAAINAEVERRLAAMAGQQQQPAQQQHGQNMPNSFAAARNNGPRSTPAFSGPKPLSEIMGGR